MFVIALAPTIAKADFIRPNQFGGRDFVKRQGVYKKSVKSQFGEKFVKNSPQIKTNFGYSTIKKR